MAHAGGRPTKYNKDLHPKLAKSLAKQGLIDEDIAKELEIAVSTLYKWKIEHEEFSEALKVGKDAKDDQVENALLRRALGYEHEEDKIFNANGEPLVVPTIKHYPPDPTAIIYWLKNRRPGRWRDKTEVEQTSKITNINIDYNDLSDNEAKKKYLEELKNIGDK